MSSTSARATSLAKNTLIISLGTFLPKAASFITLPILTGVLTQDEYGTYDLITIMVSLLLPAATLQIKSAAFRFLIDVRDDKNAQREVVTNILIFTAGVSSLAVIILYFVLGSYGSPLLRLFICAYLFLNMMVDTLRQVARGLSKNFVYSLSSIASSIGQLLAVALLVWLFKSGLDGAVLALIIADLFSLAMLSVSLRPWELLEFESLSSRELSRFIAYSWPMVPNELSNWVMRVSNRVVITAYMGVSANAVFAVANKIPQIITLAQGSLTLAWQENASVYSRDKDIASYYSKMFDVMIRFQVGVYSAVVCLAPLLFSLLVRGDYGEAYRQMPILCLAVFFSSMATFLGGIYVANMKTRSVGITTLVAAAINLVFNLALIDKLGLWSASGANLLSYIVLFFFRAIDVRNFVAMRYKMRTLVLVIAVVIIETSLFFINQPWSAACNIVFGLLASIALNLSLIQALIKSMGKVFAKHVS